MAKVLHIITDLNGFGGTEATLLRYLSRSVIPRADQLVIVLKSTGVEATIGAQMIAMGIPVIALGLENGWLNRKAFVQLYREFSKFNPDVISGWLYHPSLIASLMGLFAKKRPAVVWNIRSLTFASLVSNPSRFLVQRTLAIFASRIAPRIVTNSRAAFADHARIGFPKDASAWTVIPNGLDLDEYFPCASDRRAVRAELRIPEEALVIVCVGRFVPEKGHVYLFEALRQLKDRMTQEGISNVHILAVGNGVSRERPDFAKLADIGWPPDSCHFLGRRADVARLLRAADLFVLPSVSEAFPNSLVEAMATGLPCITTDVGECQTLVSDARFLVAPKDVERLSAAVLEVLGMDGSERVEIGRENRAKVFEQFTIEKMVRRFDAVFLDAAKLWNSARK